jgi:hypothetical protein
MDFETRLMGGAVSGVGSLVETQFVFKVSNV